MRVLGINAVFHGPGPRSSWMGGRDNCMLAALCRELGL